ncbi:MAG: hypothetical protein JST93_21475 [Acidobacteria bacterium]|nr:hypothetical protein [Acidobacteriota bacterium]
MRLPVVPRARAPEQPLPWVGSRALGLAPRVAEQLALVWEQERRQRATRLPPASHSAGIHSRMEGLPLRTWDKSS